MSNDYQIKGLLFFFIILFACISNTTASINDGTVKVTEIIKGPFFVSGEKNAELHLIINNEMDSTLSNVKVYLFVSSPFTPSVSPNDWMNEYNYPGYLVGSGDSEYIPSFDIGSKGGRTVKFKIDVEKNAKYGQYDVPYAIHYDNNRVINGKFTVRISGSTLVEIIDVSTYPENIVPGNDFMITFNVKNCGENTLKWVKVDVSADDKKIIPIFSTTEKIFTEIAGNGSRFASYNFSTDRKIEPMNYPFMVTLNYQDENGISYNETKIVGVKILRKASPGIASFKVEPDRILQGELFTLIIRIENNEQGDAISVKTEIDIPVTGDKTAFLGKIAPDEDAPAVIC